LFPEGFETTGQLDADELLEPYESYFQPEYTTNYSYSSYVYDLNLYKPRESWKDLINRLFDELKLHK